MPLRVAITKQTASGEQFVTDVCQWNPVTGEICHEDVSEMSRLADEMLKLADMRSMEMHTRMLEAYSLREHCTPETWYKIQSVLDILAGNVSADTVARRWQSEIEENAELVAAREAVYTGQGCTLCSTQLDNYALSLDDSNTYLCRDCAEKVGYPQPPHSDPEKTAELTLQREDIHHCQEYEHTMPQREYDAMVERSA